MNPMHQALLAVHIIKGDQKAQPKWWIVCTSDREEKTVEAFSSIHLFIEFEWNTYEHIQRTTLSNGIKVDVKIGIGIEHENRTYKLQLHRQNVMRIIAFGKASIGNECTSIVLENRFNYICIPDLTVFRVDAFTIDTVWMWMYPVYWIEDDTNAFVWNVNVN